MESYLLDTSALTPLIDRSHLNHTRVRNLILNLNELPIYVSVFSLAEMKFGFDLHEKRHGTKLPNTERMIRDSQLFPRLDVNHHTASEYASLKATIALHYLPDVTREFRKKWVEDWIDQFTCKRLGIDDNDLWICAQARELNFTLIANDKMTRIRDAEPRLKFLPIEL